MGLLTRQRHGDAVAHLGTHELVPAGAAAQRRGQLGLVEDGQRLACSLQLEDGRANEELEPHERRDGVPGQAEHERRAAGPERNRLPRLHRDAPEHLLDAELGEGRADEVVRPDRDAARGDENVGLESPLERGAEGVRVVGDRVEHRHLRPRGDEAAGQHRRVGLVDLPGAEWLAGAPQLRPRGQDRRARPAGARDPRDPGRPECAESRRGEPLARREHEVAGTNVEARSRTCAPRSTAAPISISLSRLDNVLDRDDRIRAVRDDAARRDPEGLALAQRSTRGPSGGHPLRDGQRAGRVRGPEREAVHRRGREGREVDDGMEIFRGEAAGGVAQLDRLRRKRCHTTEHEALGLLDRGQGGHGRGAYCRKGARSGSSAGRGRP